MARPNQGSSRQSGFVLPYVLVVIAILAVAGTIAANRLQNTLSTLGAISSAESSARLIDAAEAEVIFALMAANTVPGGYDLNPSSLTVTEFGVFDERGRLMDPRDVEAVQKDIWPVKGGARQVSIGGAPVVVVLQDVSGLPSVNKPNSVFFRAALEASGVPRTKSGPLITYLQDYIDSDNRKSMGGAERSDYSLVKMPTPTNSPVRSFGELSRVMGWAEAMKTMDMTRFKSLVTLNNITDFREGFISAELQALPSVKNALRADRSIGAGSAGRDIFALAGATSTQPSNTVRISLYAPRGTGVWDKRVIEITRQGDHITKPYRRLWVLDATVLDSDLDFDPAQLAELDHVIDPASLRP